MAQTKAKVDLETATGLRVEVFRSETDCTNGGPTARFNRLLVLSDQMARCPVPAAGTDPNRVLVVVPSPAAFGRFVARPISPNGELRSGSFGGNFIHSGDQRFSEAFGRHPIPVHDRFEDRRRTPLAGDHEISRRVDGALRLLSNSDRTALLAELLVRNLDLESDLDVAGYYWGRNRGARHVGVNVSCFSRSIEGEDALRIAPVTRRDRIETSACTIDLTRGHAAALVRDLLRSLSPGWTIAPGRNSNESRIWDSWNNAQLGAVREWDASDAEEPAFCCEALIWAPDADPVLGDGTFDHQLGYFDSEAEAAQAIWDATRPPPAQFPTGVEVPF